MTQRRERKALGILLFPLNRKLTTGENKRIQPNHDIIAGTNPLFMFCLQSRFCTAGAISFTAYKISKRCLPSVILVIKDLNYYKNFSLEN